MSTIAILAHRDVAHELGHLGDWCEARGHRVSRLVREDAPLRAAPEAARVTADALVVLGSPTSVAEAYCAAPAEAETALVGAWVGAGRPYLGICFGAQVLARALGGRVRRMPATVRGHLSIGAGEGDPLAGRWPVWHEDAIEAPSGAHVRGRLPHADLAFCVGAAWGLQPHVEFTAGIVERLGARVGLPRADWGPLADALADDPTLGPRTHGLLDAWATSWG